MPVTVIGKGSKSAQLAMMTSSLLPGGGANIHDVIGFQGTGAWDSTNADEVWRWHHRTGIYERAWLFDSSGYYPAYDGTWFDLSTGGPSGMDLASGLGFWMRNKSGSSSTFYFNGLVAQTEVSVPIDVSQTATVLHQMGQPLPIDAPLDEANTTLVIDGARGGWDSTSADEIWSYIQSAGDTYQRSWLFDSGGYYPAYDGIWFDLSTGGPTTQVLSKGLAWWYRSKADVSRMGTPSWYWTEPIPY